MAAIELARREGCLETAWSWWERVVGCQDVVGFEGPVFFTTSHCSNKEGCRDYRDVDGCAEMTIERPSRE